MTGKGSTGMLMAKLLIVGISNALILGSVHLFVLCLFNAHSAYCIGSLSGIDNLVAIFIDGSR